MTGAKAEAFFLLRPPPAGLTTAGAGAIGGGEVTAFSMISAVFTSVSGSSLGFFSTVFCSSFMYNIYSRGQG